MTGTELAKKLNLPKWRIMQAAKKINPYCFEKARLKQFTPFEIKEIEAYLSKADIKQEGVRRASLAKEYGLSYKQAFKITKEMGIPQKQGGSMPFMIPEDRVAEFKELALSLTENKKEIDNREPLIRAMYDRILREGYVSSVEVHKTIPGNNDSVLSKFHNMGLYIYDDYITVPALNGRGNPNGKIKKVRVFKANETIWNEWRKEQNAIQKNGHIDTNDRSITTARRVG